MDKYANSNQGLTTTGRHAQHTQERFLENLAQVTTETVPLGHTGHLLYKATPSSIKDIEIYLTHRKEHREKAKISK